MMFAPQHQPDPRIPGIGLAFFRTDLGGHRAVEHDGVMPGFDAHILVAPDDGVAVFAVANGARRGLLWLAPDCAALLRRLLDVPGPAIRSDIAHRPEIWPDLCGWYRFPARLTDPGKLAIGAGVEVFVRHGRLAMRFLSPVPALYKPVPLYPDDDADPYVFRIAFPWFGVGTSRVVFTRQPGAGTTALHLDVGLLSFRKHRPR